MFKLADTSTPTFRLKIEKVLMVSVWCGFLVLG